MKNKILMMVLILLSLALYHPYLSNCDRGIDHCEAKNPAKIRVLDNYFFTGFSTGIVSPHNILPIDANLTIGRAKFLAHPGWSN